MRLTLALAVALLAITIAPAAHAAEKPIVDLTIHCSDFGKGKSPYRLVTEHAPNRHFHVTIECADYDVTTWSIAKSYPGAKMTQIGPAEFDYVARPSEPSAEFDLQAGDGHARFGGLLPIALEARKVTVVGIGDSWTAGFGYFANGDAFAPLELLACKPGSGVLNDRCSSNSDLPAIATVPVKFAWDYGLSNNIAWPAQVMHDIGIPDKEAVRFRNFGVSGAEPKDFLPGGQLHDLMKQTIALDPDITLVTMGGNPILGDVIGTLDDCADDRKKGTDALYACAARLFQSKYHLTARLVDFYEQLLKAPSNEVVISNYMFTMVYLPLNDYSFGEVRVMARAMREAIDDAVDQVRAANPKAGQRLHVVAPVDVPSGQASNDGPVKCRRNGNEFQANGSSVLADIVQSDMALSTYANRFCGLGAQFFNGSGWVDAGKNPWFNSHDLGTHLTRLGNKQLADAAFALIRRENLDPFE